MPLLVSHVSGIPVDVVPYGGMSISLGAAAVGALASLVFTGMLVRRCIRVPRMATVALFFATTGLTVALVAQVVGYDRGFSQITFRAVQIGAQLIAPLALTWALAELTGKSLGARFTARLGLGALTVVGAVVLATDPLSSASFSKSWPPASVHYQLIPNWVLEAVAVVAAVFAVVAVIVVGVRGRRSPEWRSLFLGVALVAAAAVATDWLRATFSANTAYPLICLAAAALAWFGAVRASKVRLESLRSGGYSWDEDTGSFVQYHDDSGEFGYDDTGGFGRDRGVTDGQGWYADDAGGYRRDPADTDFGRWFRPGADTGSFHQDPADTGGYDRGPDSGSFGRGDAGSFGPPPGDSGGFGPPPADSGGFGPPPADSGGLGPPSAESGGFRRDPADAGGLPREAADAYGRYGVVPQEPDQPSRGQNGAMGNNSDAYVETGDVLPVLGEDGYPLPPQAAGEDTSRLYGQIAIYTLLDETADDFERLASEVVEQVKTREPGTLVYVMHGVPAAPMQRILYAVYRDEAAFDEHERQPYIRQFEEEREPFVLATNVIELGVKLGKFAPTGKTKRVSRVRKARPASNSGRLPSGESGW
jgi:quinol monooxygenase YgiN